MKLELRKGRSCIVGIIGVLLAVAAWRLGTQAELTQKLLYGSCAVLALGGWWSVRVRYRVMQFLPDVVWAAVGWPLEFYLSQWLMNSSVRDLDGWRARLVCGALICGVVVLALYVVLKSVRWSTIIGLSAVQLLSTANSFIYTFRGNELIPADFTSFVTAMNVAGGYEYHIKPEMIRSWILLVAYFWIALLLPTWSRPTVPVKDKDGRVIGEKKKYTRLDAVCAVVPRLLAAALAFYIAVGVMNYGTDRSNVIIKHFKRQGTDINGFIVNFYLRIPEMLPDKPEGYSKGAVTALEERVRSERDGTATTTQTEKLPTIIAIMDESFSDIAVRSPDGVLNTNEEVIPYILSLRENAISGYAIASVYGGNTPNSEYEFLTGHSMAWAPFGTIAYQNDVKEGDYSLVTTLKQLGYSCTAMHPYKANGWKRPIVYDYLGFDEMFFEEDFPQENLVREFVSDQEMFEKVIDCYEQGKDAPQFIYGVTMQNHGGYEYSGDDFKATIKAEGYKQNYKRVNQYLTLIHETDKAVENLIHYFSAVQDDVVIVFFGDHQPHIGESFYKDLHGGELETMDEKELQYQVPFFIWANYDIDEQYLECTSLNYLASYTLKTAGLELPPYQQFLLDLSEKIPAVNQIGYYSLADGCFKELENAEGEEAQALREYAVLQYNNIHDRKNSSEYFFPSLKE